MTMMPTVAALRAALLKDQRLIGVDPGAKTEIRIQQIVKPVA